MKHPRTIWASGIALVVVGELACDRRHDASTISSYTRAVVANTGLLGRALLAFGCWSAAEGFRRHIVRPLTRPIQPSKQGA